MLLSSTPAVPWVGKEGKCASRLDRLGRRRSLSASQRWCGRHSIAGRRGGSRPRRPHLGARVSAKGLLAMLARAMVRGLKQAGSWVFPWLSCACGYGCSACLHTSQGEGKDTWERTGGAVTATSSTPDSRPTSGVLPTLKLLLFL